MTALARKVAEDIAILTVAALERERETTERILSEKCKCGPPVGIGVRVRWSAQRLMSIAAGTTDAMWRKGGVVVAEEQLGGEKCWRVQWDDYPLGETTLVLPVNLTTEAPRVDPVPLETVITYTEIHRLNSSGGLLTNKKARRRGGGK